MPLDLLLFAAGGMLLAFFVVSGSRRGVLALAAVVVLAGSSAAPALVERAFYARFVAYGALVGASVISWSRRPPTNIPVPILLLIAVAVTSVAWSVHHALTLQRSAALILLVAAALASASHWSSENVARGDCRILVMVAVALLFGGLLARVGGYTWVFDVSGGVVRYRGLLENPNTVGLLAATTAPLALGIFLSGRPPLRRWWVLALGIILVSVVLSGSRGGLVAVSAGLAACSVRLTRSTRWKIAAGTTAVLVASATAFMIFPALRPTGVQNLVQRFEDEGQTSLGGSGRLEAWSLALETWTERPVGGWGFGTTEAVFGPRALEFEQVFVGDNPHNAYLHALMEIGLIGPFLLITIVVGSCAQAWRLGNEWGPMGAGLFGALVGGAVSQVLESGLTSAGSIIAFHFWLIAGGVLIGSSIQRHGATRDTTQRLSEGTATCA